MKHPLATRIRSVPIGWPAIVLLALGWAWDLLQVRPGGWFSGHRYEAAISFAATWLVTVLLLMAAWDLFVAIDDDPGSPSLGFGPQKNLVPAWLRPAVVPVAFVAGIYLGHQFWL